MSPEEYAAALAELEELQARNRELERQLEEREQAARRRQAEHDAAMEREREREAAAEAKIAEIDRRIEAVQRLGRRDRRVRLALTMASQTRATTREGMEREVQIMMRGVQAAQRADDQPRVHRPSGRAGRPGARCASRGGDSGDSEDHSPEPGDDAGLIRGWTCPDTGRDLIELHDALAFAAASGTAGVDAIVRLLRAGCELLLADVEHADGTVRELVLVRLPDGWREMLPWD